MLFPSASHTAPPFFMDTPPWLVVYFSLMNRPNPDSHGYSAFDVVNAVIKRKKLVITSVCAALLAVGILYPVIPKIFKAEAAIVIAPGRMPPALFGSEKAARVAKPVIVVLTHADLLRSNEVFEKTAERMAKDGRPVGMDWLKRRLQTDIRHGSVVIMLEAYDTDRVKAVAAVNAWAEAYRDYQKDIFDSRARNASLRLAAAKGELEKARKNLRNFGMRYDLRAMESALSLDENDMKGIRSGIYDSKASLLENRSTLKALEGAAAGNPVSEENAGLRQKISESRILAEAAELKIKELQAMREILEKRIRRLSRIAKRTACAAEVLENDVARKQEIYDNAAAESGPEGRGIAGEFDDVKIVSYAVLPEKPVSMSLVNALIIGGFAGAVLGILLAFFAEFRAAGVSGKTAEPGS